MLYIWYVKSIFILSKIFIRCFVILVLFLYLDLVWSLSLLLGKLRGMIIINMVFLMFVNVDFVSVIVCGLLVFRKVLFVFIYVVGGIWKWRFLNLLKNKN